MFFEKLSFPKITCWTGNSCRWSCNVLKNFSHFCGEDTSVLIKVEKIVLKLTANANLIKYHKYYLIWIKPIALSIIKASGQTIWPLQTEVSSGVAVTSQLKLTWSKRLSTGNCESPSYFCLTVIQTTVSAKWHWKWIGLDIWDLAELALWLCTSRQRKARGPNVVLRPVFLALRCFAKLAKVKKILKFSAALIILCNYSLI